MLGLTRSRSSWSWIACGKHPVAKDYIWVGPKIPPLELFYDWVERGCNMLESKRRNMLCSWRFWSSGSGKEDLVCGLGKDSSDSLGRWYPFLILGYGPLSGWQAHWDLVPLAAENTWTQLELLSVTRFTNFKELEDAVRIIAAPDHDWDEFSLQRDALTQRDHPESPIQGLERNQKSIESPEGSELFDLQNRQSDNPSKLAILRHEELRKSLQGIPQAVFMGGTPHKSYLAIFNRSLVPQDFVRLWSIS